MTSPTDHPFQPGTRVAITSRTTHSFAEDWVEKVYKNGNFTLRSNPKKQWRPWLQKSWTTQEESWQANRAGSVGHWTADRGMAVVWDETTDAKIQEQRQEQERKVRLRNIKYRVECLTHKRLDDGTISELEAILDKIEGKDGQRAA